MQDGDIAVREGRSEFETIEYYEIGNHQHAFVRGEERLLGKVMTDRYSVEGPCTKCRKENDTFEALLKRPGRGAHFLEERMHKLQSYRAYAQRWPFDMRKMVLSAEVVFEDHDGEIFVEGSKGMSTLETIMDTEAADELLSDLTPEERQVIRLTSEGYKPREIATLKGDKDSARVRQDKYSAMRKLGAPINRKMRRVK